MPTNLLATDITAADSSDVPVSANEFLTVCLKDAAGTAVGSGATIYIQIKDDTGQYFTVDKLTWERPALVLSAGTYRFRRNAGVSCGVFSG